MKTIIVSVRSDDFHRGVKYARKFRGRFHHELVRDGKTYKNVWEISVERMGSSINAPANYGLKILSNPEEE